MKKFTFIFSMFLAATTWGQNAGQLDVNNFATPNGFGTFGTMLSNTGLEVLILPNSNAVVAVSEGFSPGGIGMRQGFLNVGNANYSTSSTTAAPVNINFVDAAIQADTMVIVVGDEYQNFNGARIVVKRFFKNGTEDNSFTDPFTMVNGTYIYGNKVAIQSDNKILLADEMDGMLYRLQANGAIDSTFDSDGKMQVYASSGAVTDLLVGPDNRIYVAGQYAGDFRIMRLNANGTYDVNYGNSSGYYEMYGDGAGTYYSDVKLAMAANGHIFASALYSNSNTGFSTLTLVQLDTNGQGVTSFGGNGNGTVSEDLNSTSSAETWNDIVLQADGKIVVVGSLTGFSAVARFTTAGVLDNTFNSNGYAIVQGVGDSLGSDEIFAAQLQNGHLVVTGESRLSGAPGTSAFVARVLLSNLAVGVINPAATVSETLIYPNPLRGSNLQLEYELLSNAQVRISVVDLDGRQVAELSNEPQSAGKYNTQLQLPDLSNGQYLLRIEADKANTVVKFTVAK